MTCGPRTTNSPTSSVAHFDAGVGIDQTGLGVRQRHADGAGTIGVAGRIGVRHRTGLGQAVALDDGADAVLLELGAHARLPAPTLPR